MTVAIRLATLDELPVVQELNHAAFENDAEHDPYLVMTWPFDKATGAKYFKERISSEGVCLVATDGTEIVGYLAGSMRSIEPYRQGRRSELENMFVVAHSRRAGVGSALIDAFVAWSKEQQADEVYVSAYYGNERAVSFYMNNGFASYSHDLLLNLRDASAPPADN